jgi:hypothetical protein
MKLLKKVGDLNEQLILENLQPWSAISTGSDGMDGSKSILNLWRRLNKSNKSLKIQWRNATQKKESTFTIQCLKKPPSHTQ